MTDLLGYPYNGKYPPKGDKRGIYHDYASDVEETLFHDFDKDHVALCDEHYTEEYQVFPDGNTALEQFKIDGKSLLELIDQLEEVEPV